MARALILALYLGLFGSPAWAGLGRVEIGNPAPGFSALGSDGRSHALTDYAGRIVVLEWTSPVCPYTALKYQRGLMQAIQGRAAKAGVVWLSINTSPPGRPGHLTVDAAKARLLAIGAQATSLILDEDTRIGQAYGVRTTPTVFVIGKDGRLAYQGAVDPDPQRTRDAGQDYVTAALRDLRSGRPVKHPLTRAYGCAVEY
jgi:AhpC/TSA family